MIRRAAFLLGLTLAGIAHAQSPAQFLPREPGTRLNAEPVVAPPRAEAPAPVAPPKGAQGILLTGIRLEGATALGESDLRPLWADLIGQTVDAATLDAVAAAIGAAYRARGYVLSQALLPEQTVTDGIVTLLVIEGFIDRIGIEGGAPDQNAYAGRLFAPVAADRPLRLTTLERAVLLGRDTFGGAVETVIEPAAETFGAADLGVLITPLAWRGFAAADNRGSRLYGDLTASAGASAFNLLGLNEQIDALVAGAPQNGALAYGQLRLEAPIVPLAGSRLDGTRLVIEADRSRADPDLSQSGSPQDLDIIQHEVNARLGLFTPFIRTRSQNLLARLSLDWQQAESDSDFAGEAETTTDRLLVLEARLGWDIADRTGGVSLIDARLRQGLPTGATQIGATGPAAGKADFTALALTLSRLRRLGTGGWSLYGEAIGQYATTVLPVSERFALGDATIGRGFAPGNTTGDSGYGARLELRRGLGPETLRPRFGILLQAAELYGFADYGAAYDRSLARDGERWQALGSVGFGARIDVTPWLTITPEIARQTEGIATDTTRTGLETRAYLGIIARF